MARLLSWSGLSWLSLFWQVGDAAIFHAHHCELLELGVLLQEVWGEVDGAKFFFVSDMADRDEAVVFVFTANRAGVAAVAALDALGAQLGQISWGKFCHGMAPK